MKLATTAVEPTQELDLMYQKLWSAACDCAEVSRSPQELLACLSHMIGSIAALTTLSPDEVTVLFEDNMAQGYSDRKAATECRGRS